jgi:hypothetical protein
MAKRPDPIPPSRRLNEAEQAAALTRLVARIKDIEELDTSSLVRGDDPAVQAIEARVKSTLANIFGEGTPEYRRLLLAADLDATTYILTLDGRETHSQDIRKGVEREKERALALLRGETDAIRENIKFSSNATGTWRPVSAARTITDEVFVVHGHDETAKNEVAHFIERAGLKAVILSRTA